MLILTVASFSVVFKTAISSLLRNSGSFPELSTGMKPPGKHHVFLPYFLFIFLISVLNNRLRRSPPDPTPFEFSGIYSIPDTWDLIHQRSKSVFFPNADAHRKL